MTSLLKQTLQRRTGGKSLVTHDQDAFGTNDNDEEHCLFGSVHKLVTTVWCHRPPRERGPYVLMLPHAILGEVLHTHHSHILPSCAERQKEGTLFSVEGSFFFTKMLQLFN